MMKNWENNGTGEIGLVTPTPGVVRSFYHPVDNYTHIEKQ